MTITGADIQTNYSETLKKITSSKEHVRTFLRQNTHLYKYPMAEIVSIHGQNKQATKVADFDFWNANDRFIRSKEKALRILTNINDVSSPKKYYFDILQTTGKHVYPFDWSCTEAELREIITRQTGEKDFSLKDYISKIVDSTVNQQKTQLIHDLTRFTLGEKFQLNQDLEDTIIEKATGIDPVAFLTQVNLSNQLAKHTLNRLKPFFVDYMTIDQEHDSYKEKMVQDNAEYEQTITAQGEYIQEVLFDDLEEEAKLETKDGHEVPLIPKTQETSSAIRKGFRFPVYTMATEQLYGDTPQQKINDNLIAIRLFKSLQNDQRLPSIEEKETLARYVGWGGLANFFDKRQKNETYESLRDELQTLVTQDEYNQMEESVLTAYYTDPKIIEVIFNKSNLMGFKGGKVLDPAMGTGNFFSVMPQHLKDNSELHGVELDSITGGIASYLHDDATIQIKPFEQTTFEDNSFDLVIGNIPFNDFKISDKRHYKKDLYIHDYFISRSLDVLKEDGILAVISSAGTLDKRDNSIRQEWAKKGTFMGAVRLPNNAFKRIAGTEVVTDILFFKKNSDSTINQIEKDWLLSETHTVEGQELKYNNYFNQHLDNIIGKLSVKNFRGGTLTVTPQIGTMYTLQEQIEHALESVPNFSERTITNVHSTPETKETKNEDIATLDSSNYSNFSYSLVNDKLYFKDHETMRLVDNLPKTKQTRIKGMLVIKDKVKEIITIQQVPGYNQEKFSKLLKELNHLYDTFVKKYGYFHDDMNDRAFRADDGNMLLQSLEIKQKDGTYKKADLFFQATIRPVQEITHVETSEDALIQSITRYNLIDFDYMTSLSGRSKEVLIEELKGKVFVNPETEGTDKEEWLTREEYLSGDVKTKLEMIRPFKENYPLHYQLLREVQPEPLGIKDIEYKLGSTWIPKDIYQEFITEILETPYRLKQNDSIFLDFEPFNQKWFITGKTMDVGIIPNQKYGTKQANGYRLIEESLNLKLIEIKDKVEGDDGKEKYVLNQKETILARDKQELLETQFKAWLFSEPTRTERLLTLYNERFNRYVPRKYDGRHLQFNGLNTNFSLRPHQKNAVARALAEKRALFGHVVGSGKSLTMIASGMLLKEKGIINKPLYVVPNHLTSEFGQELLRFYPTKNVLVTTERDFKKENRKEFTGRIATGNYDAIIIGQTQFEKIPLSKERQIQSINEEIAQVSTGIAEQAEENSQSWSFKQMKLHEKKLKERLEKLMNAKEKDNVINFEETGIDFLFVDEAHYYKNLYNYTKLSNIAGINTSHSQRATDMYQKTNYLLKTYGNKGVIFATGTPISNSMGEMFTMQRYLEPDILEQMNINSFDQWASTFGEITSSLELAPEGTNYQIKNRFAKFHNLPELMTSFSLVADIQTEDMLDLPVPTIKNGKATIVVTEATQAQEELMDSFSIRAEEIRKGNVDPRKDNMLKVTNEAKLMALDMRLIDDSYTSEDSTKVQVCCENVFDIYQQTSSQQSTQMIFCDSGTPKKDKFNVYDEIKRQLIEKGVLGHEIAFIHDAKNAKQRDVMFEKMRNGQIRILLGSTGKVGTGTNVQTKLIAAHHLDCPWRPSDLTQRDGRIVRQGNENKEVEIYRYITKSTFDSYLWQIQEQKLRYITQVMNNKSISRTCEDIDETVLTAAEIKAVATNNPLIAEKMTVDNRVMKLQLLEATYKDEQHKMNQAITEYLPNKLEKIEKTLTSIHKDQLVVEQFKNQPFSMVVKDKTYTERKEAGEAIHDCVHELKKTEATTLKIGQFKGLNLVLSRSSFDSLALSLKGEYQYSTDINLHSSMGTIARLENLSVDSQDKRLSNEKHDIQLQLKDTKKQYGLPFEYAGELANLLEKQREINHSLNGFSNEKLTNDNKNTTLEQETSTIEKRDSARLEREKLAVRAKRQVLSNQQLGYE